MPVITRELLRKRAEHNECMISTLEEVFVIFFGVFYVGVLLNCDFHVIDILTSRGVGEYQRGRI